MFVINAESTETQHRGSLLQDEGIDWYSKGLGVQLGSVAIETEAKRLVSQYQPLAVHEAQGRLRPPPRAQRVDNRY